ncbi:hypothetical protein WMY93_030091 [Mugilogobius chulae]|uniref:Uncharacterized protein n=1 Tax=Mugilogobius chulae TaxID=88201 RepID=A0AAW0MWT3_9GOBI
MTQQRSLCSVTDSSVSSDGAAGRPPHTEPLSRGTADPRSCPESHAVGSLLEWTTSACSHMIQSSSEHRRADGKSQPKSSKWSVPCGLWLFKRGKTGLHGVLGRAVLGRCGFGLNHTWLRRGLLALDRRCNDSTHGLIAAGAKAAYVCRSPSLEAAKTRLSESEKHGAGCGGGFWKTRLQNRVGSRCRLQDGGVSRSWSRWACREH